MGRLRPTALKTAPPGLHPDGDGLYLQVKNNGRSWLHRYTINGKARWMGLGPYPEVSLAAARHASDDAREALRRGLDPIELRRQAKQAARIEAARSITFRACAAKYIEAHRPGWRNPKHAAQWDRTLETYAYPTFGDLPVQQIDTALVMQALEPIWETIPETATRVRQRIESVLDWATAREFRKGDNPARWRGHLDKLLPPRNKISEVEHHEAMPYAELPAFFDALKGRQTASAKALSFSILTAARSGEVRGATIGEIDLKSKVWIVSGKRTKSGREHRVPLADEAISLLKPLIDAEDDREAVLFPNRRRKPLSDTAMRKYLQEDMSREHLTVHGFRSTFRDWAAEQTNFPRELAEAALAHVLRNKTEAAYQRGDMLERRRTLMDAWAKFCISGARAKGQLIPLRRRAR